MYRLKIFDYLFRTENTLPIFSTSNCKNFTIFHRYDTINLINYCLTRVHSIDYSARAYDTDSHYS